jgi:hypothetical protein
VRPPSKDAVCPFCNGPSLHVVFSGPLSIDQIRRFELDRRTVEEHELRIVAESRKNSNARQLTPADFGLSDENAFTFTPSSSPSARSNLLPGLNTGASVVVASSPLRTGFAAPAPAAAVAGDDDSAHSNDDDASNQRQLRDDDVSDADGAQPLAPEDFGLSAVPQRFVGMSIAEIDEALLEEAIAMSLAESVSPPSAGFLHQARSSASAAAAAAAATSPSPSSSSRGAASASVRAGAGAGAAADGEASAESDDNSSVAAAQSNRTPASAPQRIALRKEATPPGVVVDAVAPESSKSSAKHSRTTSTSSRSDDANESDSSAADPAMRNALFVLSVASSADVSDPDDEDLSPSKKDKGGSQRRRRKTITAAGSSSANTSNTNNNSNSTTSGAATSSPSHRRTSSASKPRDAVET